MKNIFRKHDKRNPDEIVNTANTDSSGAIVNTDTNFFDNIVNSDMIMPSTKEPSKVVTISSITITGDQLSRNSAQIEIRGEAVDDHIPSCTGADLQYQPEKSKYPVTHSTPPTQLKSDNLHEENASDLQSHVTPLVDPLEDYLSDVEDCAFELDSDYEFDSNELHEYDSDDGDILDDEYVDLTEPEDSDDNWKIDALLYGLESGLVDVASLREITESQLGINVPLPENGKRQGEIKVFETIVNVTEYNANQDDLVLEDEQHTNSIQTQSSFRVQMRNEKMERKKRDSG